MPQLTNLVLTDRAATPVAHTFAPRDIVNNVAAIEEAASFPIGNKRITLSLTRTPAGRYKATIKGSFPVVQVSTVNSVDQPTVVRSNYFDLTFNFAETSSLQERKDIVGMLEDALGADQTFVDDLVTKLQGIY